MRSYCLAVTSSYSRMSGATSAMESLKCALAGVSRREEDAPVPSEGSRFMSASVNRATSRVSSPKSPRSRPNSVRMPGRRWGCAPGSWTGTEAGSRPHNASTKLPTPSLWVDTIVTPVPGCALGCETPHDGSCVITVISRRRRNFSDLRTSVVRYPIRTQVITASRRPADSPLRLARRSRRRTHTPLARIESRWRRSVSPRNASPRLVQP